MLLQPEDIRQAFGSIGYSRLLYILTSIAPPAFENGAAEHLEEALTSAPAVGANGLLGKPYTMLEQFGDAVSDKCTAQDYYTRANQLENQIAQDASRDRANGDNDGCVIL